MEETTQQNYNQQVPYKSEKKTSSWYFRDFNRLFRNSQVLLRIY